MRIRHFHGNGIRALRPPVSVKLENGGLDFSVWFCVGGSRGAGGGTGGGTATRTFGVGVELRCVCGVGGGTEIKRVLMVMMMMKARGHARIKASG